MKALSIVLLLFGYSSGLMGNAMPWATITESNAYWAGVLGVEPAKPIGASAQQILKAPTVSPDASLQLINAALQHQVSQLPNNELIRFVDTLSHLLVFVSGGQPMAADLYGRAGWWRLSYPVAVRYGLRVDSYVDERLDFERATLAAMQYVKDLQKQFCHQPKAWMQAFVESPLAVTRPNHVHDRDSLYDALRALKVVLKESVYATAEQFAINHFFGDIKEVRSKAFMLIDVLVENTGIPKKDFLALNPELHGGVIPAKKAIKLTPIAAENLRKTEEDVVLLSQARVEEESTKLAQAKEKAKNNQPDPRTATTYRVRNGDNLGKIAAHFGVGVSELKSWNNLRGDLIYAGQKLLVYGNQRAPHTTTPAAPASGQKQKPTPTPLVLKEGDYISYKVKNGDTLWSIAKQFPGVSPENLMEWNGINTNIKVGQEIKILKEEIRDYSAKRYPNTI